MKTYEKIYPKTGSTLTIKYPDGLFFFIEDDPRKLYKHSINGNDRTEYPDVVIMPSNGVFINKYGSYDETTTTKRYVKNNGSWSQNGEPYVEEVHKTADANRIRDRYTVDFYNAPIICTSAEDEIQSSICYTANVISINARMEYNEAHGSAPDDLTNITGYSTTKKDVVITIFGETDFFESNADFYCCYGEDEHTGEMYCNSYFNENQNIVGGVYIRSQQHCIEISPFSIKQHEDVIVNESTLKFSSCHEGYVHPIAYDYEKVYENDCQCDGFMFTRQLSYFPYKDKADGSAQVIPENELTYRGTFVQFILEPLVILSQLGSFQGQNWYYYFDHSNINESLPSLKAAYKEDAILNMELWQNSFWPDNIAPATNGGYVARYEDECKWLFTTMSTFNAHQHELKYYYNFGNELLFSNFFTTAADYTNPSQYIIVDDFPLYEYGTVLYPVWYIPSCMYTKLNSDAETDPKDVMGNDTRIHQNIKHALLRAYGENFIHYNIDVWNETNVQYELKRLKESPCKFKVLYINCHGGKYTNTDESYAELSEQQNQCLTFEHIKYLLENARNDEYYFIYLAPCYSGGLIEDYVHNNIISANYAIIDESNSLSANHVIVYSDCSNSPSWAIGTGNGVGDIYDFTYTGKNYQTQVNDINQDINECRTKNIQLLVDFMRDNYDFMNNYLLKGNLHKWTNDAYQQSISNAANLIIHSSRQLGGENVLLIKDYPIVFLYQWMIKYGVNFLPIDNSVVGLKTFLFEKRYYTLLVKRFQRFALDMCIITQIDEELELYENDENNEDDCYLTNPILLRNVPNEKKQAAKLLLARYVVFFYNWYVCYNQMSKNSNKIRAMNKLTFATNRPSTYMLDDIPGIIFHGMPEFGTCTFPKFPGYDEASMKLTLDRILDIAYINDN